MKPNGKFYHSQPAKRVQAGFALLDIVLAIAVFAFGMLALIQLQGNLARSSSDANTRTVATNIAEELVETLRGYRSVLADPDTPFWDFVEMEGNALNETVSRGGIDYGRTVTITNFWWDEENNTFVRTQTAEPPPGLDYLAYPDFKLLRVDVNWGNNQKFYVSDSNVADDSNMADLGTGIITVYEIIPSSPPILGAQLASSLDADTGPLVKFNPGENPEIVALQLDDKGTKFKESSSPEPTVIAKGGVRETWFDVVTYSGLNDSIFLRREEFVVVNCECTLEQGGDGKGGYRPTLWNGYDYTEGAFVSNKDYGITPKNSPSQSVFCDTCCRDHHDGGSVVSDTDEVERIVYDPWSSPPAEDHAHYTVDLELAGYGDIYVEACRLIRKDGFFRVTHDFNQQALFAFPYDYLDVPSEVFEYSGYVVEAVTKFVQNDNAGFKQPGDGGLVSDFLVPASSPDALPVATAPTSLPTPLGFPTQQLRSRGIYVDYLTDELRTNIANCPGDGCVLPGYTVDQEMYPFLEVQLTALSRWADSPINHPVDVEAELFLVGPVRYTGLAKHDGTGGAQSEVETRIHAGNIGFVGMDPIVPADLDDQGGSYRAHNLYINAFTEAQPPVNAYLVEGSITKGAGVPANIKPSNTAITFDQAECNRAPTGYKCLAPKFDDGTVTFTDTSANRALYFCAGSDLLVPVSSQAAANNSWATFTLPKANATVDIVIQTSSCGG